jgi:hypothetical protein
MLVDCNVDAVVGRFTMGVTRLKASKISRAIIQPTPEEEAPPKLLFIRVYMFG